MCDLATFAFPTTTMSSLPSLREFDDADLAESPSDSEEFSTLKFKERMRRKREHQEREERERQEREEWEARERAEREERETREREACEEEERAACKKVHL